MSKGTKLNVNDTQITVISENKTDFISLTDMTSGFNEGSGLIGKWITNKNTLEYVGTWEKNCLIKKNNNRLYFEA